MVFSKELGYDPDEWEECSDSEQFMLFGFTTRMFIFFTAVILTVLFFWFLENRKRVGKSYEVENVVPKNLVKEETDNSAVANERMGKVDILGQTKINFSKEEMEALEEWHREVARIEELRLRDLIPHMIDASSSMTEIKTESQLIDSFLPSDHISMDTNSAEMEQTGDQTSSQITLNTFTVESAIHSVPYTEDIVSSVQVEFKLNSQLQDAANTIVTGSERGTGSGSSTNGWEAPAQSEFLFERNQEGNDVLMEDFQKSAENEDDFIKIYKDDLQKSEMLQEQNVELSKQANDTLNLTLSNADAQKILEQRRQPIITELSPDQLPVTVTMANCIPQESQHQVLSKKPGEEILNFIPTTMIESMGTGKTNTSFTGMAEGELLGMTGSEMNNKDWKPIAPAPVTTSDQPITDEERKRLIEAEIYLQDAIEYASNEIRPEVPSKFIVEEMFNSKGANVNVVNVLTAHQLPISLEATSQMFRTNEIFEKGDEGPIEIDDAMTYAPEIQSIEIPPDEASVNSEKLLEYFDEVAAECANIPSIPQPTKVENVPLTKAVEISQSASLTKNSRSFTSTESQPRIKKRSSLLSVLGVTSMQEMLLTLTSLEDLSIAMRKAGLQSTNLIFGIDYTASNKYQGERCFQGRSLHSLDAFKENPYQQVIKIMGRILAPFTTSGYIPAYGFGDMKTSDWSVFKLKPDGECKDLDELLQVYDAVTPTISLSGPTNFAPLIYEAIEICEKFQNYHILVIIADGQVTNEKATRKAIVRACQHPLSIIVVGVGDGPWDMMKVFDESLPRRPWDNFHFVEFNEVMKKANSIDSGELSFAIQSLLEIPDQYSMVRQLGLVRSVSPIPEHDP